MVEWLQIGKQGKDCQLNRYLFEAIVHQDHENQGTSENRYFRVTSKQVFQIITSKYTKAIGSELKVPKRLLHGKGVELSSGLRD